MRFKEAKFQIGDLAYYKPAKVLATITSIQDYSNDFGYGLSHHCGLVSDTDLERVTFGSIRNEFNFNAMILLQILSICSYEIPFPFIQSFEDEGYIVNKAYWSSSNFFRIEVKNGLIWFTSPLGEATFKVEEINTNSVHKYITIFINALLTELNLNEK